MKISTVIFRSFTRLLLAALLLQVVSPAALAAVKQNGVGTLTEICTTSGSKWVQADSDGSHSSLLSHGAADHCVFCNVTGAGAEFDARRYLSIHASPQQPVLAADRDLIVQFSGHSIRSRAPPFHS